MVDDGRTSGFLHDPWISDLSLNKWPTFVNAEFEGSMKISDLLYPEESRWHSNYVAQLFGPNLAERVLSIAVPTHEAQDMRVNRSSCGQRVRARNLYMMYCGTPARSFDAAWI